MENDVCAWEMVNGVLVTMHVVWAMRYSV